MGGLVSIVSYSLLRDNEPADGPFCSTTAYSTQTLSVLVVPAPAPVPRCSPFIFINKLAEWTNVWSDSNPYFPVPPCEYGGPLEALARGDLQ